MAKKPYQRNDGPARGRATASGKPWSSTLAAEPLKPDGGDDTIRPALKLSELVEPHGRQPDGAPSETLAARQRLVDRVRASMRLPTVEDLAKQLQLSHPTDEYRHLADIRQLEPSPLSAAMAGLSELQDESVYTRMVEAIPGRGDLAPVPLAPQQLKPIDDKPATATIASTQDLGRLVREARAKRGLSQQAFADLVGVGRRFISELENGKPTVELGKALQVAAATGIDVLARRRQ